MGGFAVPPPIRGGFEITPPDPYANLRALAMQGQIAQQRQGIATAQQEMQARGQQMQLVEQQIKDQQALAQALKEWTPDQSPDDFVKGVINNGGSGNAGLQAQQHFIDLHLKNTQLDEAKLTLQKTRHDQLAGQIQAVIDARPEDKQALYAQYLPEIRKELDPGEAAPDIYPGDTWGAGQAKGHLLISAQTEQDLKRAQAGAEISKGKQAEAEAKLKEQETRLTQYKTDLYQALRQNPQGLKARVDASIDPLKYPALNARALNEAGMAPDMEGIDKAIKTYAQQASEQEKTIAVETSPQVLQARTQQEVNKETQLAPLRRANSIAEARALREGDNPALAGVPPAVAQFATSSVLKLDEQQIKANEATESLGRLLDLADKSNVAAGANIPLAGVGAVNAINGIRRINSAEIRQYGTAGDLIQKIQGKLQGWTEGQPIPASVRDDIRELHQQLGEASYKAYTQGIDSVNARTSAKYGPTVPPPNIRKGAAPAKAAPAVGTIAKGYRFKGGDPSKQENWEKQ